MTAKICMFTGHRNIAASDKNALAERLGGLLEELIADGFVHFRAGGALGFDTVAALKVIEKKHKYPHIRLHLFLPCRDQDCKWSESSRTAYRFVLSNADSISYSADKYTYGCMQQRNREMVDGSDLCVAYYKASEQRTEQLSLFDAAHDGNNDNNDYNNDYNYNSKSTHGGTKYTLKYAQKKGVDVLNICD